MLPVGHDGDGSAAAWDAIQCVSPPDATLCAESALLQTAPALSEISPPEQDLSDSFNGNVKGTLFFKFLFLN